MSALDQQASTPDRFLGDHEPQRDWALPAGLTGVDPVGAFDGRGAFALEVALATADTEPTATAVRQLWTKRHDNAPNPLLLIVAFREGDRWVASMCGPAGDQPPVVPSVLLSHAERIAAAALSEPSRHAAVRFLTAMLPEVGTDLPGLRNHGMFASHELRDRVPERADWSQLCDQSRPLLRHRGRQLVLLLVAVVVVAALAAAALGTGTASAYGKDAVHQVTISSSIPPNYFGPGSGGGIWLWIELDGTSATSGGAGDYTGADCLHRTPLGPTASSPDSGQVTWMANASTITISGVVLGGGLPVTLTVPLSGHENTNNASVFLRRLASCRAR